MAYRLMDTFARTFQGQPYLHRRSHLGDAIALQLYEDLYELGRSPKLVNRISERARVANRQNTRRGVVARRGDATFGDIVPGVAPTADDDFHVAQGPVATVEIGVEVKILAKAMMKQIDRVTGDLLKQIEHFRRGGDSPICVGIVGLNWAPQYTSFEGTRTYTTDGRRYAHPIQEAATAEARLRRDAAPRFDEFLILSFRASNVDPFPFEWMDLHATELDYGAALARISRRYEERF